MPQSILAINMRHESPIKDLAAAHESIRERFHGCGRLKKELQL